VTRALSLGRSQRRTRGAEPSEVFPTDGNFANFQALTGNWDRRTPSSPDDRRTRSIRT
jgi:hypothetical protein